MVFNKENHNKTISSSLYDRNIKNPCKVLYIMPCRGFLGLLVCYKEELTVINTVVITKSKSFAVAITSAIATAAVASPVTGFLVCFY